MRCATEPLSCTLICHRHNKASDGVRLIRKYQEVLIICSRSTTMTWLHNNTNYYHFHNTTWFPTRHATKSSSLLSTFISQKRGCHTLVWQRINPCFGNLVAHQVQSTRGGDNFAITSDEIHPKREDYAAGQKCDVQQSVAGNWWCKWCKWEVPETLKMVDVL